MEINKLDQTMVRHTYTFKAWHLAYINKLSEETGLGKAEIVRFFMDFGSHLLDNDVIFLAKEFDPLTNKTIINDDVEQLLALTYPDVEGIREVWLTGPDRAIGGVWSVCGIGENKTEILETYRGFKVYELAEECAAEMSARYDVDLMHNARPN